jgi:diguanylate cyclase (GGDEF)-like protein
MDIELILKESHLNLKNEYTIRELNAVLQTLHGKRLASVFSQVWELSRSETVREELEEEHVRSLQRLFENESKKIELEALHEKLSASYSLLEKMSRSDVLTGLYNRAFILNTIEREIKRTLRVNELIRNKLNRAGTEKQEPDDDVVQTFSFVMFDVDHFKTINDSYGHLIGDEVLIRIGQILMDPEIFRSTDYAGRYGGDEFLMILPNTKSVHAEIPLKKFAEKLHTIDFYDSNNKSFHITLSIGVTEFIPGDTDFKTIIERADQALYFAKKSGRNRIAVFENLTPEQLESQDFSVIMPGHSLQMTLRPIWGKFEEFGKEIEKFLSPRHPDVIYGTKMVATELIENAIKYGNFQKSNQNIDLTISLTNDVITIKVSNWKHAGTDDIVKLQHIITLLQNKENKREIFTERLRNIFESSGNFGTSQLGLIRIVYEAQFDLTLEEDDERIFVTASRNLSAE